MNIMLFVTTGTRVPLCIPTWVDPPSPNTKPARKTKSGLYLARRTAERPYKQLTLLFNDGHTEPIGVLSICLFVR